MPRKILTTLIICSLPLFSTAPAHADWLDKLKDTAKELTDKAGEVIKEAEPEAPSTSDGEGQVQKPATTAAPAKPAAPETKAVAEPAAPAGSAVTGNNDKTLVMATQKELKRLGYKIGVDGAYGPNTKNQIIAFQKSQNLKATGDASPDLLAKLKATPTPAAHKAEPATATAAAPEKTAEPAPAPEKKAEPAPAPEKKAEPAPAPEKKTETAAVPKESDYDRFYEYEGSGDSLKGAWLIISDKPGSLSFYGEIRGDELITRFDLRSLKLGPDAKMGMRGLVSGPFRKTDSYDPPSSVILRFDGDEIVTRNVSRGSSANLVFEAKGPRVAKLLNHLQDGSDFDYRIDHFEPFEYSKDWVAFHTPPPSIAAAKKAEKEKQAAAMAAEKAEQEKKKAYAAELSPEGKMAFERCEQNTSGRTFYSCQCVAENMPGLVDTEVVERVKELERINTGYLAAIQKNEENPKLSAEQKEKTKTYMLQKIDTGKAEIAKLENRAGWDTSTVQQLVQGAELKFYKEPTCKTTDGMREKEYKACMGSSSSKNVKGKTPEEYCSCSADTAADLWMKSNQAYSSKVAVSIPVQARTQCRK